MPTPAEIIDMAASLQNDTAQTKYTDAACLPYLNMALDELQEIFEANNIPTTNVTSALIVVPDGTTEVGFATVPALPSNLIEIQQLWESDTGQNKWTGPMTKKEFIPHYLEVPSSLVSHFGIWAWENQFIKLPAALVDIDLKLDYIASIFSTPIAIADISVDLPIKNIKSFLGYKTGALCAMFIGENESRAIAQNSLAVDAITRSLGISIKGTQSITVRRRPFRASYKARRVG